MARVRSSQSNCSRQKCQVNNTFGMQSAWVLIGCLCSQVCLQSYCHLSHDSVGSARGAPKASMQHCNYGVVATAISCLRLHEEHPSCMTSVPMVAQVIAEILFGVPTVSNVPWALVTFAILVVTYAIAMVVPNIWPVMVSTRIF